MSGHGFTSVWCAAFDPFINQACINQANENLDRLMRCGGKVAQPPSGGTTERIGNHKILSRWIVQVKSPS